MLSSTAVTLANSVYVSVAHRYWNLAWNEELNRQNYGREASNEGLGSNMRVELAISGREDLDESCLLKPLAEAKKKLDHQCLFSAHATSLEQITQELADDVFAISPAQGHWLRLTIDETERLSCTSFPGTKDLELTIRVNNLSLKFKGPRTLPSGLVQNRAEVASHVAELHKLFAERPPQDERVWCRELSFELKRRLMNLSSVKVDLGRHESLMVDLD